MAKTQNELSLKERQRERKGEGFVVKARGQWAKYPIGRAKRVEGPVPSPRHHALVGAPHPPQYAHTHTPAEEALHSRWGESWSSYCGEADQTVFHASFLFSLALFLPLSQGSVLCIHKPAVNPNFTVVTKRCFRSCLKFPSMCLCLLSVFLDLDRCKVLGDDLSGFGFFFFEAESCLKGQKMLD